MAIVYYIHTAPGSFIATAENDEPLNAPFGAPWVPVAQSVYQAELLGVWQGLLLDDLNLKVTRNKDREGAVSLNNNTLDTGKTYAVFLPDLPELGYTQVDFDLDTVFVNSELGAPWDYAGTDGFGFATKVIFTPGSHTIDATVTYGGGSFVVSATFDVD